MTRYSQICSRCDGSGKYDRGTCFGCNGMGTKSTAKKPRTAEVKLVVTYTDGSKNFISVFSNSANKAVEVCTRQVRMNGWTGIVSFAEAV